MKKVKITRVNAKTGKKEVVEMDMPEGKTIKDVIEELSKKDKEGDSK